MMTRLVYELDGFQLTIGACNQPNRIQYDAEQKTLRIDGIRVPLDLIKRMSSHNVIQWSTLLRALLVCDSSDEDSSGSSEQ